MSLVEKSLAKLRISVMEASRLPAQRPEMATPADVRKPIVSAILEGPSRRVCVNDAALHAAGLLPEAAEERHFADQYRRIKRPILDKMKALAAISSVDAQLFMVASALPGDGKTFTSIHLALSIARERDVSLLLVDADVAKPHISRLFGVDQEPGLMDALGDAALDVETFVLPTDISGLSILPAGRQQEAATELLASARMSAVVARLSARDPNRLVMFDSPPLLLSNESRAVAQIVGQVVLVVRSGITPQTAVQEALRHIGKEKLTGLVLNQNDLKSSKQYYGHGSYGDNSQASAR